jgi:DnaJ homolog subfamily C member 17
MADDLPPDLDIYTFLGITYTATDSEINSAYRKLARTLHPDKNPSPTAVQKFHHLELAKAILLSPSARVAYDNVRKAKAAKTARTAKYDDERRRMQRDLEAREREAKRRKMGGVSGINTAEEEERILKEAVQKLKEESERLKRERDARLQQQSGKEEVEDVAERTVKIRFQKGWDRSGLSTEVLEDTFTRYGQVENVILGKSALVVFETVSGAKAAVSQATKDGDPAFDMIKEIRIVQPSHMSPPATEKVELSQQRTSPYIAPQVAAPVVSTAPKFSFKPSANTTNFTDYESTTLLRMRKIEKERLDREIRERDEKEDQLADAQIARVINGNQLQ